MEQFIKYQTMECKFKQIDRFEGSFTLPVRGSETAVNHAISCLLGNVADQAYNKTAMEKSKTFLKNKIIQFQVDSVKQSYPGRPTIPRLLKEEQSPRRAPSQCLRPMSAQVCYQSKKHIRNTFIATDSKKTIQSHGSFMRSRRNLTSASTNHQNNQPKKRNKLYKKVPLSQKRFIAVRSVCDNDPVHQKFIEELRLKKEQEEKQAKKKEDFLKSIQLQAQNYTLQQAKFAQSVSRKRFIYGAQGQIIQLGNSTNPLKKISAMSKSRVQIKPKSTAQLNKFQQQLKENIYIEFKGRQLPSRPQTGKPTLSSKKEIDPKNKFFSLKQTKRSPEEHSLKTQIKESLMNNFMVNQHKEKSAQESQVKKKIEKILFYQTPNSVYRVIDDNNENSEKSSQIKNLNE